MKKNNDETQISSNRSFNWIRHFKNNFIQSLTLIINSVSYIINIINDIIIIGIKALSILKIYIEKIIRIVYDRSEIMIRIDDFELIIKSQLTGKELIKLLNISMDNIKTLYSKE
jgi:hypothetical protein